MLRGCLRIIPRDTYGCEKRSAEVALYRVKCGSGNCPGISTSDRGDVPFLASCSKSRPSSWALAPSATTTSQGWVFPHDGAHRAISTARSIFSLGTGSGRKARILLLLSTYIIEFHNCNLMLPGALGAFSRRSVFGLSLRGVKGRSNLVGAHGHAPVPDSFASLAMTVFDRL